MLPAQTPLRKRQGFKQFRLMCSQANAVSDKLLDMRKCSYKGANLTAKVLAGALMSEADLSGANLQEAVLTKVGSWECDINPMVWIVHATALAHACACIGYVL